MAIAYAAHTETCTLLLDDEGICRQIIRKASSMRGAPRGEDSASRCIGAQYVAAIDVKTDGGLVAMPKVGAPMLFAYVGPDGRIALVRTGPLLRFETKGRPAEAPPPPAPPPPEESVEMELELDLDGLDDPTHLFRRAPGTQFQYDTSPPPTPASRLSPLPGPPPRHTIRPPAPLYGAPPPLPVKRVRLVAPNDSAPTLEHKAAKPPRGGGVLPKRRRA